jgi:signal transduction histidine kinase
MSHELRTPLNHIIGFTELIVDGNFGELTDQQDEYLNDVLKSSKHLLSLINDILDLSKVEAGRLDFQPADVDIKALLEESLTLIKEKAVKHNIDLSLDVNGVPERIRADERKLKQIMYNLLSNAVKFTPEGGDICIRSVLISESNVVTPMSPDPSCKEFIEISVMDSGVGIRPDYLESIFKPFEQVDHSVGKKYQGTGLGLSLTRSLVELHGGKIWAESEGEEQGSVFRFVIPI